MVKRIKGVWNTVLNIDAWVQSGYPPHIPIVVDFTGDVIISSDGRCLMAVVLKTTQLDLATKEHLHITMAYHLKGDLPRDIGKITKK